MFATLDPTTRCVRKKCTLDLKLRYLGFLGAEIRRSLIFSCHLIRLNLDLCKSSVGRRVSLPRLASNQPEILVTDTVGFIQKLPPHLVAAFRATLEEIYVADVIVHVVDVSNPVWRKQMASVDATLEDMGVADKPKIVLYNKIDLIEVRSAPQHLRKGIPRIGVCN